MGGKHAKLCRDKNLCSEPNRGIMEPLRQQSYPVLVDHFVPAINVADTFLAKIIYTESFARLHGLGSKAFHSELQL